jgi:cell division protein FtsQ
MEEVERVRAAPGTRSRGGSVVVPFPGLDTEERAALARLVPSGKVLLLAFAAVATVALSLLVARETPLFAVERIDVDGATPPISRQVSRALADVQGRSLWKVDTAELRHVLQAIPTVREAALDRAFPNTLRVVVVPEQAVAVARQGQTSWLVSDRGRVMHRVTTARRAGLPRIWVPRDVPLEPGVIASGALLTAVTAVAPLRSSRFPARVAAVSSTPRALRLRLRSGLLLDLGEPAEVRLKLAVAARVLPLLADGTAYLDVSVPERPVAGTSLDSQVEVDGSISTTP